MQIRSHRDLIVWQKAMVLVTECYQITNSFPDRERYGLTSQLQRAAVSVPANIAEGHSRKLTGAFLNHLSIANGSLGELETHIEIGIRLGYIAADTVSGSLELLSEVRRMIDGLGKSLRRRTTES